MGALTGIKQIRNNSQLTAQVEHNQSNTLVNVGAGQAVAYDDRVPWATNEAEFNARHIAVRLIVPNGEDIVHAVWQRTVGGDDRVRSSRNAEVALWADPGDPINGESGVRGNRALYIAPDNSIQLDPSG